MRGNKSEDEHDSSDQEMLDLVDDPSFQQSIKDASMKSGTSSKRGRPKIPLKWSRIIDVDAADGARLMGFNIDEDFESLEEELKQQTRRQKKEWTPLFHPKDWWRDNQPHDLQKDLLGVGELQAMASRAISLRKIFLERAPQLAKEMIEASLPPAGSMDDNLEEVKRLSKKL